MRINNNIAALNAWRGLTTTDGALSKSLEKLSSGLRINRAGDDAAGLAISEKMRAQIKGLNMATKNAQDGISLIQTAEGALNETHSILQRVRELAVQSASDTNSSTDRAELQKEVDQLISEIDRVSTDTEFNTKKLLNGDLGKTVNYTSGSLNLNNLQVVGGDEVTSGTYGISVTAVASAANFSNFVGSVGAQIVVGDLALAGGADIKYGSYSIEVTNFNGVASTADFKLIDTDGRETIMLGQSTEANLTIGGIVLTQSAASELANNGEINFDLKATGLNLNITGATAVDPAAFDYAGGTLNFGGFQFELTTNFGGVQDYNFNVDNNAVSFQIGANAQQKTTLAINDMSSTKLGVGSIDISSKTGAEAAIDTISDALDLVSAERSKLGAMQNRLEHTINNLGTASENLTAAESRIRDVDMAAEMMEFTKKNILAQAGTAMLAQANQRPQSVLQLLQ